MVSGRNKFLTAWKDRADMRSGANRTVRRKFLDKAAAFGVTSGISILVSGCTTVPAPAVPSRNVIQAVGAESQYASVIRQIGGKYVSVYTVIQNPNVDPHQFQVGPADAKMIGTATLVVQNGIGYDSFMNQLESATTNPHRTVIDAGRLMQAKAGVTNPHLWYQPGEMSRVASAITAALQQQDPQHKAVFTSNLERFTQSQATWMQDIQSIKKQFQGAPVAVTEPVADDLLQAAGLNIKTPWAFEAAVMNGIDPSPQSVATEKQLLMEHRVKVFIYNPQAGDSITNSLVQIAKQNHIPIVGAYETMPHGYTYTTWMQAETKAIYYALKQGKSTETMQ